MGKHITSTAEFELDAFHPTVAAPPAEARTLSVTFGFASDEATDSAAKADFEKFLGAVAKVRFLPYRFSVAADDKVTLTEAPDVTVETADWIAPPGLPKGVLRYLEERSGGKWVAALPTEDAEIQYRAVAAPHLLESARNWDAPLPELAGLTRLVRIQSATALDVESLILVPWFDTDLTTKPGTIDVSLISKSADGKTIDAELRNVDSGGLTNVIVRARSLVLPLPDPGNLIDESTGYLKVRSRNIQIADALKRLRERTPSMLWTLPQLLSLDWDSEAVGSKNEPSPDIFDLERAIWLGVSGIMTLFDPLFIALTMGGTSREGPFVAAFAALLEEKNRLLLERQAKEPAYGPFGTFHTEGVEAFITKRILALVGPIATPRDQAALLAEAFDLGGVSDKDALNAQDKLLPVVLSLYANYTPATVPDYEGEAPLPNSKTFNRKAARIRYGNSFDRQTIVELGLLAKLVQDENEIEAAAARTFAHAGVTAEWLRTLLEHPEADGALEYCEGVLTAFRAFLGDGFNGLDATRFAQGSLFESAVVAEAQKLGKPGGWDDLDLRSLLLDSNWFAARLHLGAAPRTPTATPAEELSLAALAAALPAVDLDYLDNVHEKELHVAAAKPEDRTGTLDLPLRAIVAELLPGESNARFLPDPAPRDLPVQIAVDTDINDGDTFQSRFNGVALVVRRGVETWRYANLATLTQNYAQDGVNAAGLVVHPLQPVAVDGQRRLFVDYAGVPLASRAFDSTFAADAAATPLEEHKPFYEVQDPVYDPKSPAFERLPALAYGETYAIAAHVVSKAGVLPLGLQSSEAPGQPWLPNAKTPSVPPSPSPPDEIYRDEVYLRTTAVGRVMLSETPAKGTSPRIGVGVEGVLPLAADYPRLALSAPDATTAMLDLLRNADGTGSITLPTLAGERFDLRVADLWWWKAAGTLTIGVLNQPNALPDAVGEAISLPFTAGAPFAGGSIALRIESDGTNRTFLIGIAQTSGAPEQLAKVWKVPLDADAKNLAGRSPAWLRLRLDGAGACITFTDPTGEVRTEHSASRPGSDSLLLMAPKGAAEYRRELQDVVNAQLRFPQVGLVDFDRWFSNARCRALAFPKRSGETESAAEVRATEFHRRVMTAYLGRMLDPGLAALVDAMPDLAVSALRIDLCAIDGLADAPSKLVGKYSAPLTAVIPIAPLGERPEVDGKLEIHQMLKRLASSSVANLKINCGAADLALAAGRIAGEPGSPGWQVTVDIPAGMVARLRVRAVVPERFFGESADPLKVFDDGVLQLAVAHSEGVYLFEGPSVTVEGMPAIPLPAANWIELSRKSVSPVFAGRARSYDLVASPASHTETDAWNWRKLGSIDVQTQRWRFTGRPIYSWFDPKGGVPSTSPAVWIDEEGAGFDNFEAEAFFDRDDQDADIQSKQLEPAPSATVLQSFPWDFPSATLFRHRLTLRSRYAGALLPSGIATRKGYDTSDKRIRDDWIRVAMLADRTRLQLTRPQLRALLPLTVGPAEGGSDAAAPPVMAVLDEPPFVHGGLADRISAEIRTGFGFGFEPPAEVVRVVDSRKEIGPDPRLSYFPTLAATARELTLECEGPVGLTFDTPSAPAPTFANSAILLRPRLANRKNAAPGSLEEHFLSVALRRYLDHRWMLDESDEPRRSTPIAEPCWVEFSGAMTLSAGTMQILDVQQAGDGWAAKVNPSAVDPKGPPGLDMRDLATAGITFAPQLALLHLPLEEGRASLTLFALPGLRTLQPSGNGGSGVTAGESNLPHVLASFEWHVPNGVAALSFSGDVKPYPTSASPGTLMNWTRTGKSFDVLDARDDKGAELPRLVAADLVCARDQSKKFLNLGRRGIDGAINLLSRLERNPLFVHRHIAAVTTMKAEGIGRKIEVYHAAKRVIGKDLPIEFGDNAGAALRIVTFETPARPLGCKTLVPGMQTAKFDLFALIGDKYEDEQTPIPVGLSFTYRPLGNVTGQSELTSLAFDIKLGDKSSSPFTIEFDAAHKNQTPSAVHFSIVRDKIGWICAFPDGSIQRKTGIKAQVDLDKDMVLSTEMIEITPSDFKNGASDTGEYWGDISMLTIQAGDDAASFSWNWLFTGRDLAAAEAVTAARLVAVPEAEARIIAVSPPISVAD